MSRVAKLFRTLFRNATPSPPSNEISRYDLSWYIQQLNNPLGLYNSSSTTTRDGRPVEDAEARFVGYVQQGYKANGPIFAIVLARLMLFSEARFMFRRLIKGRPGDLFGGENGELSLLERPWPNGTTGEMLARMEQDVSMAGNAYVANEGDRLRRLRPDWVSIVLSGDPATDPEVDVMGYAYRPGGYGEPVLYLTDELAAWSPIPDPEAQYRGMSWITPIVRELQADDAATRHKDAFFKNGAKPGLVVSLKESVREEQFKRFVRAMNETHQGSDAAYKTLYLAGGADVTVAGANMQQLDFKGTIGSGETRMCAAGGVPPIIVGLSEGLASATYSNYSMARRKFGDHWARPQWRSACAALANITEVPDGAELWYDDRDIAFLREDQKDAAEIAQMRAATINTHITAGFTPESAVAAVDADDVTLLVHSGMVSVQLQPPGEGVPEEDPALAGEAPPAGEEPDAPEDLDEAARAWTAAQSALHPRGPGGQFLSTKDRLIESIGTHLNGGGDGKPLDGFNREQLRRVAKSRGIAVPRGASRDEIVGHLLDDLRGDAKPAVDAGPAAGKPVNEATGRQVRPIKGSGPYADLTPKQADALHRRMTADEPWTPQQTAAVRRYTGPAYKDINAVLRTGEGKDVDRTAAEQIHGAMRAIPKDITVNRAVSAHAFGYDGRTIPAADADSFAGRTWHDPGFTSTSVAGRGNKFVQMRISVPAGTRGTYVESVTKNKGETEMLLDRGTHFRITRVERRGEDTIMHVTVVGQDD